MKKMINCIILVMTLMCSVNCYAGDITFKDNAIKHINNTITADIYMENYEQGEYICVMVNEIKNGENCFDEGSILYINVLQPEMEESGEITFNIDINDNGIDMTDKEYVLRVNTLNNTPQSTNIIMLLKADVDGDGRITEKDSILTLKYCLGDKNAIKEYLTECAENDNDGNISANDAAIILKGLKK